jgi:hypothetical protein
MWGKLIELARDLFDLRQQVKSDIGATTKSWTKLQVSRAR